MRKRKTSFTPNLEPKTILKIIVWVIAFWVLSRPLSGIGKNVYLYLGSFTNNAYVGISQSKSQAEKLIKAEKLTKRQSKVISTLKINNQHLSEQNKEVEKLRNLLDLKKHLNYKSISASVIGRSSDNWHKQLVIDKGLNENIMLGDSILSNKGIIGQIVEVGKNTSIVELISDPSYRIGCKLDKENVLGILSGKTNSIGLLEFIPIGTNVMIGDEVIASGIASGGLKPTYPPGYPVGRVIKASKKKSKSSDLYIEVLLSENLNSLSDVIVFSPN